MHIILQVLKEDKQEQNFEFFFVTEAYKTFKIRDEGADISRSLPILYRDML